MAKLVGIKLVTGRLLQPTVNLVICISNQKTLGKINRSLVHLQHSGGLPVGYTYDRFPVGYKVLGVTLRDILWLGFLVFIERFSGFLFFLYLIKFWKD